jgi:hypothetical protein
VEFYAQDMRILRDLGFDVQISTRLSERRPADFYLVWWMWAFFAVWIARLLHRPIIVTDVFGARCFRRRPWLHQAQMRYALQHATANAFLSEMEQSEVRASLVAGEHRSYYPKLAHLARSSTAPDWIEFPGIVSLTEKLSLMQRCKVYLQPSRVEGFGLATFEAMSCSAPARTSGVGAVPEVVGDAARLVDGTSPGSIAEGLHCLLTHPGCRESLGARGRARAEDLFPYHGVSASSAW